MNFQIRSNGALILFPLLAILSLVVGCGEPAAVDATPRTSKFQPVFGLNDSKSESLGTERPQNNDLDLSFFHEDHFACLELDVAKAIKNPELGEIPWSKVEEQLAVWVGAENAQLKKIDRAWMLLDRGNLNLAALQSSASPVVFVLEYGSPINSASLSKAEAEKKDAADQKVKATNLANQDDPSGRPKITNEADVSVLELNEKRIALGGTALLKKLSAGSGQTTGLAKKFAHLDLQPDVNGVLIIGPIRGLLQSIFGMAAGFSPEAQKLSELPELVEHLEFQLSLDDQDMIRANIYLEDESMTKELGRMINENLAADSAGTFPGGVGARSPELMMPVESTKILETIGKDIRERGLLTVNAKDKMVAIKLKRPDQMKELISAIINDGQKQSKLVLRTENLDRIANALKEYEAKNGALPAASVSLNAAGEPNLFSWRVALLPFLGEQELYDQFDFSQPWDSEANLKVAATIPAVYLDVVADQESNKTRIQVPSGAHCVYRDETTAPKLGDISDKRTSTAVVVEGGTKSESVWSQPGSMPTASLTDVDYGHSEENGVLMISAGFKTRIVKKGQQLESALTADGNEVMTREDFLDGSLMGR